MSLMDTSSPPQPITRSSPDSEMQSSLSSSGPPPPGSADSNGADTTLQLASEASHLTPSASGSVAEALPNYLLDLLPAGAQQDPLVASSRPSLPCTTQAPGPDASLPFPSSLELMFRLPDFCPFIWTKLEDEWGDRRASLDDLPNEVLLHILGFLEVCDLLATSRTSHHFRDLSLAPILHALRLRRARTVLPPLLYSPRRPSLADLIARRIFLTHTTVLSRKLGRSLASINLSRRLAARPSAEVLVERCVLPPECAPGIGHVAPAIVARKRTIEKERVKDGLRRWVGAVWKGEVRERSEGIRRWEERVGVGRVWKLRRFWERVGRGDTRADA